MFSGFVNGLSDMWSEGLWGKCFFAFIVALIASITALSFYGIFCAADSWYIADRNGTAEVCGREYSPAWVQFQTTTVGNTTITTPIYWPETWRVSLRISGGRDSVGVFKDTFERVRNGDKVSVVYRIGRMSGNIYIQSAEFSEARR